MRAREREKESEGEGEGEGDGGMKEESHLARNFGTLFLRPPLPPSSRSLSLYTSLPSPSPPSLPSSLSPLCPARVEW